MSPVKVNGKGGVVIPVELRKKYGWKPGDRVRFIDYGGVVGLVPILRDPIEEGMGILKRKGSSLVEALEIERTKERRRENGLK